MLRTTLIVADQEPYGECSGSGHEEQVTPDVLTPPDCDENEREVLL